MTMLSNLSFGGAERWLRREDLISTVLDDYGPQIGEMVWHSIHFDAAMHEVTRRHAERMRTLIDRFELGGRSGKCRILEVGAYAHYSVHLLCAGSSYEGVTHDISPKSLRLGTKNADEIAPGANVRMVAGDFHDLPFDDNTFDLVFIASAVHHTFRPHLVLQELLRVTRPSGVVHIENEPVERALCFYQYRGNRPESYTEFERVLIENDVRSTLESPFGGARPEALFGMTENDRIPLDVFLSTLTDGATVRDMELAVTASADLDAEVIAACRAGGDIAASVFTAIERRMRKAAAAFSEKDALLGFSLPDPEQAWRLCYQVEQVAKRYLEDQTLAARLFGAALRMTVQKDGGRARSAKLFRRDLTLVGGVLRDPPHHGRVQVDFSRTLLPRIEDGEAAASEAFPSAEWHQIAEPSGSVSVVNAASDCPIQVLQEQGALLALVRFYAVAIDRAYVVDFAVGDQIVDRHVISQSESRLARFVVPPSTGTIRVLVRDLDLRPLDIPYHFRIAVARLLPCTM